jgi:hypothetical protein
MRIFHKKQAIAQGKIHNKYTETLKPFGFERFLFVGHFEIVKK